MIAPGILFPVVGPSGAGKDTLLDEARRRLAGDPRFVFAQRTITRPADAGGEAHRALDEAEFDAEEAAGRFALSWRAHGLAYGIAIEIDAELAAGRHVVVNMSRAAVTQATRRYGAVCVLHVTAPAELLRTRLAARRREDSSAQAARIARTAAIEAATVIEIVNDGSVAQGGQRLVDALRATAAPARSTEAVA